MSKTLRKKLEEEGKWEEVRQTVPQLNNNSNASQSSTWQKVQDKTNNIINTTNALQSFNSKKLITTNNSLIQRKNTTFSNEQLKNLANMSSKERSQVILRTAKSKSERDKLTTQVNSYIKNQKGTERANKINNGTSLQKIGNTALFLGQGLVEGAISSLGNINASAKNISGINDDYNEINAIKEYSNSYGKTTQQVNNKLIQLGGNVSNTIGNMLPQMAMNIVAPGSGISTAGVSSGASSYIETLNENQDNKNRAKATAILKGTLTAGIEKLVGGVNFAGKGTLDNLAKNEIKKVKNELAQKLLSKAYEIGGEVAEENIENLAGYVVDKAINNKNISLEEAINDFAETTKNTAVTTLLLNALRLGGNTYKDIKMDESIEKIDKADLTYGKKEAMKEIVKEYNNPKLADYLLSREKTDNNSINNNNLNDKQKLTEISEKYNLSEKNVGNLIDSRLNKEYKEKQNTRLPNKDLLKTGQQTTWVEGKTLQNQLSGQITENTRETIELTEENRQKLENTLKKEKYVNNERAKQFFETAINNNFDVANEKIEALFDLPDKRGIQTKFDTEIFKDSSGNVRSDVNALYITDREGNRSIVYNPNAIDESIVEKNTIHETFHDMAGTKEANEIIDFVYNRMKEDVDFQNSFNDLKEAYANVKDNEGNILYNTKSAEFENMIKEEAVADYLGTNLGNQEYINELVNGKESRNVAQKIYDAIVKFLDKVTGYKSEEAYLRGLKNKFEKAFNIEYEGTEGKKYSIAGINAENRNFDTLSKAEQMEKEGKSAEEIWKKTKWFRGNDNKWRFEINDSKFEVNNKNISLNKEYALKDILLNADELLKDAYPQIANNKVIFTDKLQNDIAGGFSEKSNAYIINSQLLNNLEEYKKTIMHEVQHNIQVIEEFSKGSNDETWNGLEERLRNVYNKNEKEIESQNSKIGLDEYKNQLLDKGIFPSADEYWNKIDDFQNNSRYGQYIKSLKEQQKVLKEVIDKIKGRDIEELYKNTAGELEARNVEERLRLTDKERKEIMPFVKSDRMVYNKFDTQNGKMKYEINGKEYTLFFKEDIKNGSNDVSNNVGSHFINAETNRDRIRSKEKRKNRLVHRSTLETEKTKQSNGTGNRQIDETDLKNSNKSSFSLPKTKEQNTKYSQNKLESWENLLERNKINKGTTTTLGELRLPEAKRNLSDFKRIKTNRKELLSNSDIYKDEDVRAFKIATDNIMTDISQKEIDKMAKQEELPDTISYISKKRSKNKISKQDFWDRFQQKFVNKGHYIDKLAKQTGNKELTYKYDRTMNAFNEAQYSIGDEQVNSKGEVVGESLKQIFEKPEKAGLETEFNDYLLNKHNIARSAYGKGIYGAEVSAPQSARKVADYEKAHPEFKEWGNKVSKYNENNLQDMVDAGMLSKDTFNKLRTLYGDYIPTYRDIVDEKIIFDDNSVGGSVLGVATGGKQRILAPKEAMAEQTLAIKKSIRVNELGIELYKMLGKDSTVFDGINFDAGAIQSLAGDVVQKAQDGTNTFIIFKNGEMIQFKISNDLYTAFEKDILSNRIKNDKLANAILTPIEKLSKVQRDLLTTYSIGFSFNNPIKDIQDAVFNTKYGIAEFGKNYVKALYQLGSKGNIYKDYIRNGGNANTYFDYDKGVLPNRNRIQKVIDKVKNLNEVLEQAPRLAEYMSTLEHGGTKSEALYNAAEITTNFKRGGDITKVANRYGANFLNASVQGLDKQIRNITGQNGLKGYAHLITKATLLGIAPAVINHLLLSGNDEEEYYEDLPDYVKDSYYLIPSKENGKFYRIPKGRVIATLGTIGRNFSELIQGKKDLLETTESSISNIISNLAPNNPITDNIVAPIVQAKNNKAWYDGEIESTRLQKLPVAERKDEKTDKISIGISEILQSNNITKYIADKLGISPKKINYVIDQYSGGIGDILLPIATPYAETNILEDKFTTSSILKNKNIESFYTALENAELSNNSEFATDTDKLEYKYLNSISKDVGELYSQKREIQESNLSDREKREQTKKIQDQINKIIKKSLNTLNNAKINSTTANFNGVQYYKDENGDWKAIEEEDIPKGLSTETFADYKNQIAIANNNKKNEKDDEKATLTSKEKIDILKSSTYKDKEKELIYSEILGKNDELYANLKILTEKNVNINAYLQYKTEDLSADEDEKSNIKGATVSGSKKNKIINYINNSDFSDIEKIYIYGTQYSLNSNQKLYLENYINNLIDSEKITDKEAKQIYLKLKNVQEMKDGSIEWK